MSQHRSPRSRKAAVTVAFMATASLVLSACGGGGDSDAGGGDGKEVTILVTKHPLTKPMSDMAWVKELEEKADVTIRWEEVSADWDQKKNPLLAAGDVPDLIIGPNAITDSDLATFGTLFEDLSDDMDALPNVQAMFDDVDGAEAMATSLEGPVYSLPSYKRFWPQAITHQYINQQWLDTLGLETPTTWDELFDVLVAFKDGDPNGNGQADEIPLDFSPVGTTGFGYFQPTALLGSTGMTISGGGGSGIFVEDGTVANFFVDERYKDVVAFLNQCWEAGLISEEAFTQDYSTYQSVARGTGDQARVGFSWGWSGSDRFGPGVYEQYAPMAPLMAEAGQSETPSWSYDYENLTRNHLTMSAQAANKDAVLRVVNELYSEDTSRSSSGTSAPTSRRSRTPSTRCCRPLTRTSTRRRGSGPRPSRTTAPSTSAKTRRSSSRPTSPRPSRTPCRSSPPSTPSTSTPTCGPDRSSRCRPRTSAPSRSTTPRSSVWPCPSSPSGSPPVASKSSGTTT